MRANREYLSRLSITNRGVRCQDRAAAPSIIRSAGMFPGSFHRSATRTPTPSAPPQSLAQTVRGRESLAGRENLRALRTCRLWTRWKRAPLPMFL